MARRARPRSAADKTKNLPDWINATTAVAALVVGIVSLWTTIQISGLEDYFKSEIALRNREVVNLSARAERLTKTAEDRSAQLDLMQLEATRLLAQSEADQRELTRATDRLQEVRAETQQALTRTRVAEERERSVARTLDVVRRKAVYEQLGLRGIPLFVRNPPEGTKPAPIGKSLIDAINLGRGMDDPSLNPHLQRVRSRIASVCPTLATLSIEIPPITGPLTVTPATTRETAEQWMKDSVAASDARTEAITRVTNIAKRCTCLALADENVGTSEICPDLK